MICDHCHGPILGLTHRGAATLSGRRYCSPGCRVAAFRARQARQNTGFTVSKSRPEYTDTPDPATAAHGVTHHHGEAVAGRRSMA